MKTTLLQQRLARVVEVVFGGSSNAAALAAGVEPSTLHRLLEGKVGDPRLATLTSLAQAFGVPLAWLVGQESTESAQGRESNLPEPYWLLRCFHGQRQRASRKALQNAVGGSSDRVRESFLKFDFIPTSPTFPLESVSALLRSMPADNPERIEIERRFAQLETDIVKVAARVALQGGPTPPVTARKRRED